MDSCSLKGFSCCQLNRNNESVATSRLLENSRCIWQHLYKGDLQPPDKLEGQREEETLVTFRRADMTSGFMLLLQFLRSQLDKTGDKEQIAAYLFFSLCFGNYTCSNRYNCIIMSMEIKNLCVFILLPQYIISWFSIFLIVSPILEICPLNLNESIYEISELQMEF